MWIKLIILKLRWPTCFSGNKYGKNCKIGGSYSVVCEDSSLLDVTYHWASISWCSKGLLCLHVEDHAVQVE